MYIIYIIILLIFFYFLKLEYSFLLAYTIIYSYNSNTCSYYFIDQKRFVCFKFCITYKDKENWQKILVSYQLHRVTIERIIYDHMLWLIIIIECVVVRFK